MARIGKSVSLNSDTDRDILARIESVPNFSDYVKELIREDIKDNSTSFTKQQKEDIKNLILTILNDEDIIVNLDKKNIDKAQLNAIDDLFNIE